MARLPRVIAVDTAHHVTQRGNARRFVFESDADRLVYWRLLQKYFPLYKLSLTGYCLMSNHIHLVVVPRRADSIAMALKQLHGRYAAYLNARQQSSGHVWQGRYYSCPLDAPHLWAALRYIELNPVRAGMAVESEAWRWSSAALHCGDEEVRGGVDMSLWRAAWTSSDWRAYLREGGAGDEADAIRRNTHTGRPLGTEEFVEGLEGALHRRLRPEKGGRPRRLPPDARQTAVIFE